MNNEKGFVLHLGSDASGWKSVVVVPTTAIDAPYDAGFFVLKSSEYYTYAGFCLFVGLPIVDSYVYTLMAQLGLNKEQALQLENILVSLSSEMNVSLNPLARVSN